MISKSDVVILLNGLKETGVDVTSDITRLYQSKNIPIDILKKINDNRPLDLLNFYNKLRESYNKKHSKLYINIMKADENVLDNPQTILTTLTGLLNQIFQYQTEDRIMFYSHSRADEIITVLNEYLNNKNMEPAYKLLKLFKADIKVLESLN